MNKSSIKNVLTPFPIEPLAEKPFVSILMANYNYDKFIEAAVESVFNQDYQNFEIIICDDGSTDNSQSKINSLQMKDSRVIPIFKENGGHASAMNAAFTASKGQIICILDSDDLWHKEKLSEVVKCCSEQPAASIIVHPLIMIDGNGRVLNDETPRVIDEGFFAENLILGLDPLLPPASGLSFRREILLKTFPLPIAFKRMADGLIRERAAAFGVIKKIDKVLGYYRFHGSNLTADSALPDKKRIDAAIEMKNLSYQDRKYFFKMHFNLTLPNQPMIDKSSEELKLLKFLLEGKKVDKKTIFLSTYGIRAYLWLLLFTLPRKLAIYLCKFGKKESSLKRWIRKIFPNILSEVASKKQRDSQVSPTKSA